MPIEEATLYEGYEDDYCFAPSIQEVSQQIESSSMAFREIEFHIASLKLQRDTLKILKVTAVSFETIETSVSVSSPRRSRLKS